MTKERIYQFETTLRAPPYPQMRSIAGRQTINNAIARSNIERVF